MNKIAQFVLSKKLLIYILQFAGFCACLYSIVDYPFHTQESNWEQVEWVYRKTS